MKRNYWTYEICKEEALKYKTRSDFKKGSPTAYKKSIKNKWNVFSHMAQVIKPKGYWTYERCKDVARSCKNRTEFSKKESWAYNTSLNNGWIDEICSHMNDKGNIKKRCIYSYEFRNKISYIGLTHDVNKRWKKRRLDNNDIVNIHIKKTKELPTIKQLTEYICVNEAIKMEKYFIKLYKSNGWILLNRIKGGSIGGTCIKWTYDVCKEEALKYESLSELRQKNNLCLSAIYKNKWHDILDNLKKSKCGGYWTYEKCKKESSKYKTRTHFYKGSRGAYAASLRNEWLNDFFK